MKIATTSMSLASTLAISFCICAIADTSWRTDGSGRYPDAQPPLTWSKTNNVAWKTVMPARSHASPALAADRLFVCAEQSTLICVSLTDGRILWQRTNTYFDILQPAELSKAKEEEAIGREIQNKLKGQEKSLREASDKLKKAATDEALKKEVEDLKQQVVQTKKELQPFEKYRLPPTEGSNGYSTPTPVCDSKHVYVLFGTGIAACYDFDGNRQWAVAIERPTQGWGHSASPVLAGGKLLVHILGINALDPKTGQTLWQAKSGIKWGTSVHTRIGNTDVVVTPGGDAVRVGDGRILASKLGQVEFCAPIVHDNIAYFIENGGKAVKLTDPVDDKMTPQPLWKTDPDKDRYYASPVFHEGLIYTVNQKPVLSVIDAADGKVIYSNKLSVKGTIYSSLAMAGGRIYITTENGTTFVLAPGREFKLLAENKLEDIRSCPVFAGKRIYFRTAKTLYCIGE